MILVVTGAGASCDSLNERDVDPTVWRDNKQFQPPRSDQLFASREVFADLVRPELQGLAAHLRSALAEGAGLEEELEALASDESQAAQSELIALRFYIRSVIALCDEHWIDPGKGGNNYDSLVRRLDQHSKQSDEAVLYVTFNYDRLLDRSIETRIRYKFSNQFTYVNHRSAHLYKLHGSIDWFRSLGSRPDSEDMEQWAIEHGPTVPFDIIETERGLRPSEVTIPAIAIPIRNKFEFECPTNHQNALRQDLVNVHRILIIGWRGQERHFLKLLNDHLPIGELPVLVANGADLRDADRCFNELDQAVGGRGRSLRRIGGQQAFGFSDLTPSGPLAHLLAET